MTRDRASYWRGLIPRFLFPLLRGSLLKARGSPARTEHFLVDYFFRLWSQERYANMYHLFSRAYRHGHPYVGWLPMTAQTRFISLISAHADSPSLVSVRLTSNDHGAGGRFVTTTYEGTWRIVRENRGLQLDTPNLRRVLPNRATQTQLRARRRRGGLITEPTGL